MRTLVVVGLLLGLAVCISGKPAATKRLSASLTSTGKVVHDEAWLAHRKEYVKGTANWQPRHVHLAYGHNTTEVVITYSTLDDTYTSMVEYGTDMFGLNMKASGESVKFTDVETQFIHRVHLFNLKPATNYFYHVGSTQGWSPVFGFKTVPAGTKDWELKMVVLGDLGATNARSLNRLQQETHQGLYQAAIHVGDFGYDLYSENGHVGDVFFDQIEPIAGYLPYMSCPGNHESHNDFLQYRNRFSMPNYTETESLYFSFNIGPVHFVSLSSEVYFFDDIEERVKAQYEWLEADLEEATRPEVRAERPWIVLYAHRPMYCSNSDFDDCTREASHFRTGITDDKLYGMEEVLMKYSVDLFIGAHEHSYERLFPIYNYTILRGERRDNHTYLNPGATTHITTGSAGCREEFDHFRSDEPEWSAYRLDEYGYTRLTFSNHTHLYMEQVSDENNVTLDWLHLVRENHTAFPPLK